MKKKEKWLGLLLKSRRFYDFSCGPAFVSYLVQEFIQAAVEETSVSKEDAILMTKEMLVGLGRLLETGLYTLPALQEKVCVKGGVTGEGIKALESGVQDMFRQMFRNTHLKYEEDIQRKSIKQLKKVLSTKTPPLVTNQT